MKREILYRSTRAEKLNLSSVRVVRFSGREFVLVMDSQAWRETDECFQSPTIPNPLQLLVELLSELSAINIRLNYSRSYLTTTPSLRIDVGAEAFQEKDIIEIVSDSLGRMLFSHIHPIIISSSTRSL